MRLLKHRIQVLHINVATFATLAVVGIGLWQLKGRDIALLLGDKLIDTLYLGGIDKGTLYADRFTAT